MFGRRDNRKRRSFAERWRDWFAPVRQWLGRVAPPVVLVGVALAVPYLTYAAYTRIVASPYFELQTIDVQGQHRADVRGRLRDAGLMPGANLFEVSAGDAEEQLEASPWVNRADVAVELPDELVVTVEERRPAAVLSGERMLLVDSEGREIAPWDPVESTIDLGELPIVSGVNPSALREASGRRRVRRAIRVAEMYRELGWADGDGHPISEVHVDPVLGVSLVTTDGTEIGVGRRRHRARLKRLGAVRETLEQRDVEPGYILLNQDSSSDRVTVGRRRDQGSVAGTTQ